MMRSLLSAFTVLTSLGMLAPAAEACWGHRHHRTRNTCCNQTYTQPTYTQASSGCCGTTSQPVMTHSPTTSNAGACCGGGASSGYVSSGGGLLHHNTGGGIGDHNQGGSGIHDSGYTFDGGRYYQENNNIYRPGYVDGPGYQARRFTNRYRGLGSGW